MRAAIYMRVSTEKQDAAVQEPALVKLCAARGFEVAQLYLETASGAKARPTLDKLCERARRGEYQVIVVWALDRLGRDLWEIIARVKALWNAGVRVVSLNDPWTDGADGPVRDLLLMLLSWVAQFERQRLRERTRAGLEAAEKKGRKGGRPRADEKALEAARREVGQVSLLTGKVEGLRAVAKRHGLSAATLSRHLRAVASSSSADASRLPGPDE